MIPEVCLKGASPWKNHFVVLTIAILSVCFAIFLVTGYTALYWAWLRANWEAAEPYLPWARNFGMLAIAGATAAFAILFSPNIFPLRPEIRLCLSLLATAAIAFFSEFRNEGKFYLKSRVHFFGPGTWIRDELNQLVSPLGTFLYRMEYSHWNDFLLGPAIVSVLFSVVFMKIYGAFRNQGVPNLSPLSPSLSTDLDDTLRFARTFMNIGLFWFFAQAWAEKAGYLSNPHSNDEIDLPFEFGGTIVGFWMARALTKPFTQAREKFRSALFIDFLCSGVIGLLYTLIVGPFTEGVAASVAHAFQPAVRHSLNTHEYTPFQQHMRPLELLLLAGAMWWALKAFSQDEELPRLSCRYEDPVAGCKWDTHITRGKVLGLVTGYLLTVGTMCSILDSRGVSWTVTTAGAAATGIALAMLLLRSRAQVQRVPAVQQHRQCLVRRPWSQAPCGKFHMRRETHVTLPSLG